MQFCSIYIVSRVLDGDDLRCWFVRQVEQIHSVLLILFVPFILPSYKPCGYLSLYLILLHLETDDLNHN